MSYLDDPCDRCGSKRIVSKSHLEVVETFSGKQKIEVSVIECSNKTCQIAQNKINKADKKESEERKMKKEAMDLLKAKERKNNIQLTRRKAA